MAKLNSVFNTFLSLMRHWVKFVFICGLFTLLVCLLFWGPESLLGLLKGEAILTAWGKHSLNFNSTLAIFTCVWAFIQAITAEIDSRR